MAISQEYIENMSEQGYYVAKGLAVLGDVVAVYLKYPFEQTRALRLKTPDSVEAFNNDTDSKDWIIFRQLDEARDQ